MPIHDLIVIGAGPAGLAAAIAAKKAGLDFKIFEKGVLVNALFRFPAQMVFFTTSELLELGDLPFVTARDKPTRDEALRYYRRVVDTYDLEVSFGYAVTSIDRERVEGESLFRVMTRDGQRKGSDEARLARTVVIATGCYDNPNLLGVPGEDLQHVSHYYTEPHAFYRKRVVVVGGKNSAAETALELYRAGAHVTLVHRRSELGSTIKYWVKPDIENRIKEGSVEARFDTKVIEIRQREVVVDHKGTLGTIQADAVFLLTGYLADLEFLRDCDIAVDPHTNVPTHNSETFETNVPGIYLAGAVVAGAKRGEIFIENGRFHGQVVVREIVKRLNFATVGS